MYLNKCKTYINLQNIPISVNDWYNSEQYTSILIKLFVFQIKNIKTKMYNAKSTSN